MPYYCTLQDILENISEVKLAQLTDDSTSGILAVDTDYVTSRIESRSSFIDSFLIHQYELPITNANALSVLKDICVDLIIYDAYSRRNRAEVTDNVLKLKTDAILLLQDLQKGKIKLDRTGELDAKSPLHFSYQAKTLTHTDDYLNNMII